MRENYDQLIGNALYKWKWDTDFEDLCQEMFIELSKMPDDWKDSKVVVFLRFRAIDWLRKRDGKKRRREFKTIPLLEDLDYVGDADISLMPSAMFGLSGREAVVVDLYYVGWLQEDIANVLGISGPRVSQLLAKIRKDIRRKDEDQKH